MLRTVSTIATMVCGVGLALGQQPGQQHGDEAAIRATVESYVAAYNRGDAKAVAAHWSDEGEWVSPDGHRVRGRKAIEAEMAALFKEVKGLTIEVLSPSIRLVTADVAVEEGSARVTRPGDSPSEATYIAVHVKRGGKWQLDSVRETGVPDLVPPNAKLEELAWMAGEWVDQAQESTVETRIEWTKNKRFLTCNFRVSVPGMDDLQGTQVIGWDPAAGVIRSWMFDSDGGFGEGVWTQKEDQWMVKFNQVLADGRKATATNVYRRVDGDAYTWQSIGRRVDGEFMPNIEEVKVVRKGPAEPRVEAKP